MEGDTVPTLTALYPLFTKELDSEEDDDSEIHIRTCPRVPARSRVSSQYAHVLQIDVKLKPYTLYYVVRQMSAAVRRATRFPADSHASRMKFY